MLFEKGEMVQKVREEDFVPVLLEGIRRLTGEIIA
jgi:hypothetical protein